MHEPIVDTRNEASESESGKTPMAVADDIDITPRVSRNTHNDFFEPLLHDEYKIKITVTCQCS